MSWLDKHLEEFVKPYLGYVPSLSQYTAPEPIEFLSPSEMTRIKNIWRHSKSFKKPILLLGRDVWIFEVLARRENYPTTFIPECSRLAVSMIKWQNDSKIKNWYGDIKDYTVLDTGFMGSIPLKLGTHDFTMCSFTHKGDLRQAFPHMKGSRALALKIEYLPKYWKTGFVRDTTVGQEFSDPTEFASAARLTQRIYKDSSPKWI